MKIKVQAQHLKAGDIVGSGEKVLQTFIPSLANKSAKGKIGVQLTKIYENTSFVGPTRCTYWGKYTQITVERAE